MRRPALILAIMLAFAAPADAAGPRFLPWNNGTTASEPETQVQRIDADTFVIRQSIRTNFEAPFLYLLFGSDRALLIDSGAGGLRIRPTVEALIAGWLASHKRTSIPLTVAHSHGHGDHHEGDSEFANRPDTTVVGLTPQEVAQAFGIRNWPEDIAIFDLGGRPVSIIPTPGHEPAHIMVHDPQTRLILSGDMLYPGRIYVPTDQYATFIASADRLAGFARRHRIDALLGAHIEMTTTPGKDYGYRDTSHPNEHPLALPPDAIARIAAAARQTASNPVNSNQGDFILFPRPPAP
ncbi:MBL fold metallo-hydrolase [Sandarakinorhabdus rubra]|uniref:MBL fold metallo-hydrolase n=1 Tax=Sandarakinorhabdus rubra TaxID=2672568 RepID=UPI0013D95541|nr:MBL fold metallo-hydrolase [Sandarakinorhabdus rubra]